MTAAALGALLVDRDAGRLESATSAPLDAGDESALRGELARRRGDATTAAGLLDAALAHRADIPALHHACALAHVAAGDRGTARSRWQALLARSPDDPLVRFQIGVTYHDDGNLVEAARWYEDQLARVPGLAMAWINLGRVRGALGDATRALEAWQRAHALKPDDPRPLLLGAALSGERADLPEAIALASKAIDIAPASAEARFVRAAHASSLAQHALAVADLREAVALDPANAAGHSALLLELHYDESLCSPEALRAEHDNWAARHAGGTPLAGARRRGRSRLRIGYLSPRFGDAPLAALLLPVLEAHDRSRFEIVAYAAHAAHGETARRVRRNVDAWHDLPASDDDAAALIATDPPDLLVDLCGHAPGNRLRVLARRPAPRQATWLDYFDTTGVAAIDFLVGDAVHTPPAHAARFRERLVLMPHARFAYRPPAEFASSAPQRAGPLTFGSFNRHAKIGDDVIDTWGRILAAVPDSVLSLRAAAYRSPSTVAYVRQRWQARGIPIDRLVFGPFGSLPELHAAYADVDIALDPFPFNGGVTTCDALAHGIPVVTLEGGRMISRQGAALLGAASRGRWIARSLDEYVQIATTLADRVTLRAERASLRQAFAHAPLCDVAGFTRSLEHAYETMANASLQDREPLLIERPGSAPVPSR